MAYSNRPPLEIVIPRFNPRWIQAAALLVLVLWGALTAFYTVPADSAGVIQRFGKRQGISPPGLHFKMPFGVDKVTIVPVGRQQKLEFGFTTPGFTNPHQESHEPELEESMVTGDLNSALVEWVVQFRIIDPERWLFDVREPGETLRDLSEAVMREIIGDRTVDEVITIGRQDIEAQAVVRLAKLSEDYHLGATIDQVQLKNVNPPSQVQGSFNEVNKAQQERENMINLANGEYNKEVPRAKGEAASKILGAEGYALKRINEADGNVSAFNSVLTEYTKSPEVTRLRLYLETMAEILPQAGAKLVVDESVKQILPLVPSGVLPGIPQRTGTR
ncbi:MAG: FtsH protease activity modulator HflK [Verrucomicrobiales bacterium]